MEVKPVTNEVNISNLSKQNTKDILYTLYVKFHLGKKKPNSLFFSSQKSYNIKNVAEVSY